jgi:hypothetical protein
MPWQISKHKPMPLPMSGFMNLLHEYWENMNEIFSKVRNFHCPQQSLRFSLSIRSPYCGPFYGSLNISQRKKCQQGTQPTQPRLFFTIGLHRVMVFCLYSVLFEAFYDLKGDWLNIGCKSVSPYSLTFVFLQKSSQLSCLEHFEVSLHRITALPDIWKKTYQHENSAKLQDDKAMKHAMGTRLISSSYTSLLL